METLSLSSLVPDRCNFTDQAFLSDVRRFMAGDMPGFPLGLLDTDDFDRWEIVAADRYTAEEIETTDEEGECYAYVVNDSGDGWWPLEDAGCDTPDGETYDGRPWYYDEDQAIEAASMLSSHAEYETRLGFPWAWNWCWQPSDRITDEQLQRAGFTVANYTGGDGDTYRLAGIDGCGYSFEGAHFALLYAIVAEEYGWPVETDNGERRITVD